MLKITIAAIASAFVLLSAVQAQAQATRTWVSGVGDDANPCSRTAPCKTFAGAISKTAARGEISVLDPGGFGAVTITKSLSIIADGVEGGISAAATNGITVNAAATDVVHLRGLTIEGAGTGLTGIRVLSASEVYVEKCLIKGFRGSPGSAIDVLNTSANTRVFVTNSTLTNSVRGIRAVPSGAGNVHVFLSGVTVDNTTNALTAQANSIYRVTDSVVTNSNAAIAMGGSGQIFSFGNNAVAGNTKDEDFTPPGIALR